MTILRAIKMTILLRAVLALTLLAGLYLVALALLLVGPGLVATPVPITGH